MCFIKITDLGDIKSEGLFNGDFDLDAVVAVYSKEGTPTTVSQNEIISPDIFELSQNYPNPFNPRTAISYQLSADSKVTLTIFDVLGKEVATLVNKNQEAGKHTVHFNASDLVSGIYLYRLQSGNQTQIRKMTIIR